MANPIDLIESKIKEIIESSAALFPWMDEHAISVHRLVEAFQTFINSESEDQKNLPNRFNIFMHPQECAKWKAEPDWENAIIHTLTDTAQELGRKFENAPSLQLISSTALNYSEILIEPVYPNDELGETNAVPINNDGVLSRSPLEIPVKARLILENEKSFPLTRRVTNLGRRSTNHLVVNDLRVSRTHAQIRYVNGGFMIFDIGSSGGTYINGERISQFRLRSGDVISLAGVKMIFAIDEPGTDTKPRHITTDMKPTTDQG